MEQIEKMPEKIYVTPKGSGTVSGVWVDMKMDDEPRGEFEYIRADIAASKYGLSAPVTEKNLSEDQLDGILNAAKERYTSGMERLIFMNGVSWALTDYKLKYESKALAVTDEQAVSYALATDKISRAWKTKKDRKAMNDESPAIQPKSADEKLRAISSAFELFDHARKDISLPLRQLMCGLIKDIRQTLKS